MQPKDMLLSNVGVLLEAHRSIHFHNVSFSQALVMSYFHKVQFEGDDLVEDAARKC